MAKRKHDECNKYKVEDYCGELDATDLKVINDYDRILFAHNALMRYDYLNAAKAVAKEFNLSEERAKKILVLAREARQIVVANQGNIEEQLEEAVSKFEYHRQKAIELRDMKAANQALIEIGKLKQLYINKVEVEITTKNFNLTWGSANVQDAIEIKPTPIEEIIKSNVTMDEQLPF